MTKQEFETLYGLNVSDEVFVHINQMYMEAEEQLDRLHKEIHALQAALLAASTEADTDATWEKTAEVLGQAEVIRYKMDNQLDLTTQERVYIINHLK